MSAKVIWIHVGLVALFAGGVAVGHILHPNLTHQPHGEHIRGGHDATHFTDHFRKRLDLTEEQNTKVKDILDSLHKEMMGLTKDFQGKFKTLRSQAWVDIRATLSDKQRLEFEKLVEEMETKHAFH